MQLSTDVFEVDVAPQLGMTIRSLRLLADPRNLLWERPAHEERPGTREIGPAGAASIDTLHRSLVGGWFELSPHAGLPGVLDGQETMLHGEGPAYRGPFRLQRGACSKPSSTVCATRSCYAAASRCSTAASMLVRRLRTWARHPSPSHTGSIPASAATVFAGGVIEAQVRSACVLPALDPPHAALAAGSFECPHASATNGRIVDVSAIPPRADQSHDHIALELASHEVSVRTRDGLVVTIVVDLDEHPFMLLWRNFGAGSAPGHGRWDVIALEPQSGPGRSIGEAAESGYVRRVRPGEALAFGCTLTVTPGPPAT